MSFVTSTSASSGGSGNIASINTDTTAAQVIAGSNNVSVSTSLGTTTIDGSLLAPKASPTFTGTITTPLTASRVVKTTAGSALTTGTVDLSSSSEVSGNLPVTNLGSGTSASSSTFWRGDGSWATPSGGGVTTMATIGAVPNANAASISGSTLTMQPADASFGGVVTTGVQTLAGAKTFTSTVTVNTSAGASTGADITVSGATNGLKLTNAAMGSSNNAMMRLIGTVTSPTLNNFYKGLQLNIDHGVSSNIRYAYGHEVLINGGGTAAAHTVGYHSDITVAQVGALSVYDATGLYGAFMNVRGNQTTTGNGNVGYASYVGSSNQNIGAFMQVDAAGGTTPTNCGYISNVTSSGASVTAGAFFRISTLTTKASFDTLPTVSAGAVISNGNTTSPSLIVQDNTTTVFQIADGGIITLGSGTSTEHVLNTQLGTAASDVLTLTNGPSGKAGNPAGYIQMTINGSTRYIPFW